MFSEARLEIFDATGSFSVEGFSGKFRTQFSAPIVRQFPAKLAEFIGGASSNLCLWTGLDNVNEVLVELNAKDAQKITAGVMFNLDSFSTTEQAYGSKSTSWGFDGALHFAFERSSLANLAASLALLQFEIDQ